MATLPSMITLPQPCIDYITGCQCVDCNGFQAFANKPVGSVIGTCSLIPAQRNSVLDNAFGSLDGLFAFEPKDEKLPPMNCAVCSYHNEYVGKEHLIDGVYVCRSCQPRYRRRVSK